MPPPIGCEESNKGLVEDGGVTPLDGGHVVSCLRRWDVKDPAESSWNTMVSHHWLEDMLYRASAYRMRRKTQRARGR